MPNNLENETPTNEGEQDTNPEESTEANEELTKAQQIAENQKIRAEKAEAELKKLKADKADKEVKKEKKESNEPDYAKLAYLKAEGITHPDDQKVIQDEATRLKLPLTDVLQMDHIKTQLKKASDQREAEAGMPDGSGKGSTGSKNSVDYWVDKKDKDGNYVNPTDPELEIKVVNARISREKKGNMFADDKY